MRVIPPQKISLLKPPPSPTLPNNCLAGNPGTPSREGREKEKGAPFEEKNTENFPPPATAKKLPHPSSRARTAYGVSKKRTKNIKKAKKHTEGEKNLPQCGDLFLDSPRQRKTRLPQAIGGQSPL